MKLSLIVIILNFFTFLWLGFWALRSFWWIARGRDNSILFLIIVHFLFCGVPPFLDIMVGVPAYVEQPGFYLASRDENTCILYCLYVCYIPLIWWITGKTPRVKSFSGIGDFFQFLRNFKPLLFLLLVSPLFAILNTPNPLVYLNYAAATKGLIDEVETSYHILYGHKLVSLCSLISILAGVSLLASAKRIQLSNILTVFPFIFISIWVNGKRYIFVVAVLLIGYVFWRRGYLKGVRFIWGTLIGMVIIGMFSSFYQSTVREIGVGIVSPEELYTNVRIDYGRDDVIKMTIYSELYPEKMRILEYRGQSIMFYLTMYIPRKYWHNKPLPYAQYFTSAMLLRPPGLIGWGMTTTWLAEALSNFGWFGILVGPLTFSFICRIGDAQKKMVVSSLTILVGCLLQAVELVAFAPLFLLWVFSISFSIITKKRYILKKSSIVLPNIQEHLKI